MRTRPPRESTGNGSVNVSVSAAAEAKVASTRRVVSAVVVSTRYTVVFPLPPSLVVLSGEYKILEYTKRQN